MADIGKTLPGPGQQLDLQGKLANDPSLPLFVTMARLGHKSITTTQGYVRQDLQAEQTAVVAALERASPSG